MVKHPKYVEGYQGSLEELARAVGNMAYDQTASFIEKLADDLKRQADSDSEKGREQLASKVKAATEELYKAAENMGLAWKICKPYMKK